MPTIFVTHVTVTHTTMANKDFGNSSIVLSNDCCRFFLYTRTLTRELGASEVREGSWLKIRRDGLETCHILACVASVPVRSERNSGSAY